MHRCWGAFFPWKNAHVPPGVDVAAAADAAWEACLMGLSALRSVSPMDTLTAWLLSCARSPKTRRSSWLVVLLALVSKGRGLEQHAEAVVSSQRLAVTPALCGNREQRAQLDDCANNPITGVPHNLAKHYWS